VPGYLTSATQLADGDAYAVPAEALHADAEVAVEIGAGGAIAGYAPALELVDLAGTNDPEAIVAANLWHRAFALGPWRAALPPGDVEARLVVNGEVRAQGVAAADLAPRIDALGRILDAAGERLRPGDVVITGGVVQVPVAAGDEVVAELRPLGRVRLRVSPPSAAA
jgi:2-keto-4-pentenoate hydratase